jgi:hypothetical protein
MYIYPSTTPENHGVLRIAQDLFTDDGLCNKNPPYCNFYPKGVSNIIGKCDQVDDVVDGIQDKVFVIKYTQSQKSCLFKNERDDLFFTYDVPGY